MSEMQSGGVMVWEPDSRYRRLSESENGVLWSVTIYVAASREPLACDPAEGGSPHDTRSFVH